MSFLGRLFGGSKPLTPLQAVRQAAKASLSTFVSERAHKFPGMQPFIEAGRDHLIVGHHCAEIALGEVLANRLGLSTPLIASLGDSPFRNSQRFFAAIQVIFAYHEYFGSPQTRENWLLMRTGGACDMYCQPYSVFFDTHARTLSGTPILATAIIHIFVPGL